MNESSEGRTLWRRPEALPFDWEILSARQKAAVETLSGWILDAVGSLDARLARREMVAQADALDTDRRSQISFIDGDRGTGKSSVLLTLRAITGERYSVEKLPAAVERLRAHRHRLRWLETLDMEPLSKGTNLFAAILARVAAVVDESLAPLPPMASALIDPRGGFEEASVALQQLQNDAAIVWDRIDARAPDGDPQVRALWVNQAEKAGLDLNRRVGQVMDGVARLLSTAGRQEMLFILPVDDFDLAPTHCLELLRLIRMITTPRLLFVVAGNVRVAETALRLKSEGDLLSLGGGGVSRTDDLLERASEIAANNMRKLVPPGQRVRLRELTLNEALGLGKHTVGKSLREVLAGVEFESNQAPTLNARLSLSRFLLIEASEVPLTSANWLAGTPRQVLDHVAMFDEIARLRSARQANAASQGPADEASDYATDDAMVIRLLDEAQRQIREEWRLPFSARERLIEGLDTSITVQADFGRLQVEQDYVELDHELGRAGRPTHVRVVRFNSGKVRMRSSTDVSASGRQREGPSEVLIDLPFRLTCGMQLVHDLVISLWGGYVRHTPLPHLSKELIGPRVVARWQDGVEPAFDCRWPMPGWWTFRDIERFDRRFGALVGPTPSELGAAWFAAFLEVFLDQSSQPPVTGSLLSRVDSMLGLVISEAPTRTARRVLRESVLVSAALMLAPEYNTGVNLSALKSNGGRLLETVSVERLAGEIRAIRATSYGELWRNELVSLAALAAATAISPSEGVRRAVDRLLQAINVAEPSGGRGRDAVAKVREALDSAAPKDIDTALASIPKELTAGPGMKPLIDLIRVQFPGYRDNPFNAFGERVFVPDGDGLTNTRLSHGRIR